LPNGAAPLIGNARAAHQIRWAPAPAAPRINGVRAPAENIRNFSIIAHIDHGKSTLADRILEVTGAVDARKHRPQMLDSMELERERGITIKAQAVRVEYTARDGETYRLHLIDTPGHVDFTYEVSRSLEACDGALLLVDASQGVEAQTLANTYLAVDGGLELIPALNKIDLPGAEPERVAGEIHELLGEDLEETIKISAKTGEGVEELLEAVVRRIPPPQGDLDAPPRALIFDSEFDQYRGVIAYVRVVDGEFKKDDAILAMQTGTEADIDEIGFFSPEMTPVDTLNAGEVGYVISGIKDVAHLRVGDTLTTRPNGAAEALPGYREVKPMVFCGLFPVESNEYPELRDALEKLSLNDAALTWEPETSQALGFGFRCGFLGLLHMDIVRERLEREYDLELLATTPNVQYELTLTNGDIVEVHSPTDMPDREAIAEIREPYIRATILAPKEYVGQVMELCQDRRGTHVDMSYLSPERVQIQYDLPLAEIVLDFFDQLKTRTKGYASLDYELIGTRPSELVKLDILLAGDPVDALSMVVHKDKAYDAGRALAERLRKQIPRQQFEVAIQASIGSKIIARESVKPVRKDVIAKCYGGDISRKKKLLEKQKEGKKRMKQVGRIEVPQEAFLTVLSIGDGDGKG
jgi:GTP-binding protein LepA